MAKKVQRRLAAILAADVVGYSRLMEADEAGTLGAISRKDGYRTLPRVTDQNIFCKQFTKSSRRDAHRSDVTYGTSALGQQKFLRRHGGVLGRLQGNSMASLPCF